MGILDEREVGALVALVGIAAERIGSPVARAVVHGLASIFGAAALRSHVDEWEAARIASNTAFEAKYGEKP